MTHACIVSILKFKLIPCLHEHFSKIVSNQIIWLCLWLCHWCFELFVKHHPNFSSFPTFLKFQTISVCINFYFFFQLERSKILNSGSARSLKASNYLVFTANKSYIFKAWFLPRILELFPKWGRGFPFEERFRHLQVLPFLGFSSRSKILTNFRTLAKSPFFKEKWLQFFIFAQFHPFFFLQRNTNNVTRKDVFLGRFLYF